MSTKKKLRIPKVGTKLAKSSKPSPVQRNASCVYDFTLHSKEKNELYCHEETEELRVLLVDISKKFTFQLERGEEKGKLHYQGRFSLKVKRRIPELVKVLKSKGCEGMHLSLTSNENRTNDFYVSKEETRVAGPFTESNYVYIPRDIRNLKLYAWQEDLKELLKEYNTRQIDIIYDPIGNNGKTTFTRYMSIHEGASMLPFCNDYRDVMRIGYDVGPRTIYLVDLPRALDKTKMRQFTGAIETLKSGYAFDDRNHFKDRHFDRPRIAVFTNVMPDLSYLSADMWHFWQVTPDRQLVKMKEESEDLTFSSSESESYHDEYHNSYETSKLMSKKLGKLGK